MNYSKNNIFLSIITINLNNAKGLSRTIESVKSQSKKSCFEYILIDGNSNDFSIDLINNNKSICDHIIIEDDKGIYYAKNKGLSIASGEYIIFLNSGDVFYENNSVENIFKEYIKVQKLNLKKPILYYSDTVVHTGKIIKTKSIDKIWKGMICSFQSVLIETYFLKKNKFDTDYKIAADYKILLQAYNSGECFYKLDKPISKIEPVGKSSDFVKRSYERWIINRNIFKNDNLFLKKINDYYTKLLNKEIKSWIKIKGYNLPQRPGVIFYVFAFFGLLLGLIPGLIIFNLIKRKKIIYDSNMKKLISMWIFDFRKIIK